MAELRRTNEGEDLEITVEGCHDCVLRSERKCSVRKVKVLDEYYLKQYHKYCPLIVNGQKIIVKAYNESN